MAIPLRPIETSFVGRERQALVAYLMANHALDAEDAAALNLDSPATRRALDRLIERGVVRQPRPDRYFVDLNAWADDADDRRQRGVQIALGASGILAVLVMLLYAR
ncbi:MAG: hypothetical protein B7Y45_11275 [Sphingomonas sp. 28-66-16]|nr:MAG: hypothetical protein B7Y45_11275 [Sphingomonas sp. 28-66-16]